jgi:hypothetical protein
MTEVTEIPPDLPAGARSGICFAPPVRADNPFRA